MNLAPLHTLTKYPPAYLLLGLLPYQSPIIDQNNYYEPVDEARELALQRTIDYHIKNKATILSGKLQDEVVPVPQIPMILSDSPSHSNICNFQFTWYLL
ncbi:hypothetical protein TNCV_4159911 [Trichonephila clavipes]|nr:hypothetical protein TNCV_4159911 [Trichonephila clavipes]